MDDQSLAHSRYNCTYHIVFIPKYRRKAMFGNLRKEVGDILGKVCRMEDVTISLQDGRCNDHQGCDIAGSCAYVCFYPAQNKCLKDCRKNQREERVDDLRQAPRVQGEIQQAFLGKRLLL